MFLTTYCVGKTQDNTLGHDARIANRLMPNTDRLPPGVTTWCALYRHPPLRGRSPSRILCLMLPSTMTEATSLHIQLSQNGCAGREMGSKNLWKKMHNSEKWKPEDLMKLAILLRVWKVRIRLEIGLWQPTGRGKPLPLSGFRSQMYNLFFNYGRDYPQKTRQRRSTSRSRTPTLLSPALTPELMLSRAISHTRSAPTRSGPAEQTPACFGWLNCKRSLVPFRISLTCRSMSCRSIYIAFRAQIYKLVRNPPNFTQKFCWLRIYTYLWDALWHLPPVQDIVI